MHAPPPKTAAERPSRRAKQGLCQPTRSGGGGKIAKREQPPLSPASLATPLSGHAHHAQLTASNLSGEDTWATPPGGGADKSLGEQRGSEPRREGDSSNLPSNRFWLNLSGGRGKLLPDSSSFLSNFLIMATAAAGWLPAAHFGVPARPADRKSRPVTGRHTANLRRRQRLAGMTLKRWDRPPW